MKEETSRVCILGPGGIGKTPILLGIVEQPLLEAWFLHLATIQQVFDLNLNRYVQDFKLQYSRC